MSIKLYNYVWQAEALKEPELVLLALALADYADEYGCRVFPSVETLATKTRRSTRTVQRNLRRLEKLRLIEAVRYSRGGRGMACEYRFLIENLQPASLPTSKGRHVTNERASFGTQKGAKTVSPHPPYESVRNRDLTNKRRRTRGEQFWNPREVDDPSWERRVLGWWSEGACNGPWMVGSWGVPPNEPGTLVPAAVARKITGRNDWGR